MKSSKKKATAKASLAFKDLRASRNPKGGGGQPHMIKVETLIKLG